MIKFDNAMLKQKIASKYENTATFCKAAGISPEEFERELEAGDISADNIKKAAQVLSIPAEEIGFYFFRPAIDPTTEELSALYAQLTPENKKLFMIKYYELLAEQEQENNPEPRPEYYYFFDCLDGILSDRYLTAQELAQLMTGASDPMPEKDIIRTAANYEATLYRYVLDSNGNPQNEKCLYDPFNI